MWQVVFWVFFGKGAPGVASVRRSEAEIQATFLPPEIPFKPKLLTFKIPLLSSSFCQMDHISRFGCCLFFSFLNT